MGNLRELFLAHELDRHIGEIPDDRVHLAANVANLGKLCRFDLDERSIGKMRETTRDFGLADTGRADH